MPVARLDDVAATEAFGARLAAALDDACAVVALAGPLGSGKTTLVRGCLRALGHDGKVRSPTYTLVEPYALGTRRVLHLDLYRIADPGELDALGLREEAGGDALWLIEWPERGRGHLPAADVTLALDYADAGRSVHAEAHNAHGRELVAALFPCD